MYSVFHGNLNYSSIPTELYPEIIDSCYWPILDTIKDFNFKSAIEFPVSTLEKIHDIDPLFINELKKLNSKKKCEIFASGQEQVVFPLVPEDVNKQNLINGKKGIEQIFNTKCNTAYVNEQLFSSGLIPLYLNANFKEIFTIFEWANKVSNIPNNEKFFPKKIFQNKKSLNIIWNSYNTYQKFQQYIKGKIKKQEYLDFILQHKKKTDSCFPFYGSDMEIFGYKNPILGISTDGKEIQRFHEILVEIEKMSDVEFYLPTQIIEKFKPNKSIKMNSAEFAILEKKPDTNIVRWAVCGRDNSKSNTMCYQLLKKIRLLKNFESSNRINSYFLDLINCWASDYRTHTTEAKYHHFTKLIHTLNNKIEQNLEKIKKQIQNKTQSGDIILFNPNNIDWKKIPYEIKLHFQPNKIFSLLKIFADGYEIPSQIEDVKLYKDRSLRSCTLIIEPYINKKSKITLSLKQQNKRFDSISKLKDLAVTSNVKLKIKKDASISGLIFPKVSKNSIIEQKKDSNQKRQHNFDNSSGHVVAFDHKRHKYTDMIKTEIFGEEHKAPIRQKIFCEMDLPLGHILKTFYVYENHPRLDIKYVFNFREFRPNSFRLGIFVLNPETFCKNTLTYSTNNGGDLESYVLDKKPIKHDNSPKPQLTSQGCLGSTEEMIDIGDHKKGLTIFSDKSVWYSVPMINYHTLGNSFFYRIAHSVAEHDDTTMTSWKGRKEISFTLLGRNSDIKNNKNICKLLSLGLIAISRNKDIIVY
jgi:hypothetical protein